MSCCQVISNCLYNVFYFFLQLLSQRFSRPLSENGLEPPNNIENVRKYVSLYEPIECLERHLKKVALKIYYGKVLEVDSVRFFVLNAKVIETMEIGLNGDQTMNGWLMKK